jgi:RimJ/RimL family protein N-acetyltransferase
VLAFGDLAMHRVFAQLDPRNSASARLCERLGMRREAYFREDIWFKGEWGDTAVYAMLAAVAGRTRWLTPVVKLRPWRRAR